MMLHRRAVLALSAAAACIATPLFPGEAAAPFEAEAFAAAQAAGKPILLHISAPWCPACKAQKPIIETLRLDPRFRDLQVFAIDFDTQKDLMRRFGARLQSTIICFRGAKEVGRSTGETQPEWIEALAEKTL
jgi:thiol-disulfide isomerase/thioredoxin